MVCAMCAHGQYVQREDLFVPLVVVPRCYDCHNLELCLLARGQLHWLTAQGVLGTPAYRSCIDHITFFNRIEVKNVRPF